MSYSSISYVPVLAHLRKRRCFRWDRFGDLTRIYVLNVSMDECLDRANTFLEQDNRPQITKEKLLKLFNDHGIRVTN